MATKQVEDARLQEVLEELKRQKIQIDELRLESQALRRCLEASGALKATDYEIARHCMHFAAAPDRQPGKDKRIDFAKIIDRSQAVTSLQLALFLTVRDLCCFASTVPSCNAVVSMLRSRIYAIGGSNVSPSVGSRAQAHTSVERLDCRSGVWTTVAPMPQVRNRAAAAYTRGKLYLMGGFEAQAHTQVPLPSASIDCFDMLKEEWESGLPPMSVPRAACAAVACNGSLHVLGGSKDGRKCLSSVELFDVSRKSWSQLPAWNNKRVQCSVAALQSKVYAMGGTDNNNVTNLVDCYDSQSQVWTRSPPMSRARADFSAAVMGTFIYVIGGWGDGWAPLDSFERFSPCLGSWELLEPMPHPAGACTAVVTEGVIYVLGGSDTSRTSKSVRCWSSGRSWRAGPAMQEKRMAAFGATLLSSEGEGRQAGGARHKRGTRSNSETSVSGLSAPSG